VVWKEASRVFLLCAKYFEIAQYNAR